MFAASDRGRFAALFRGFTLLLYSFDWQPCGRYALWPVVGFYPLAGLAYLMCRRRIVAS